MVNFKELKKKMVEKDIMTVRELSKQTKLRENRLYMIFEKKVDMTLKESEIISEHLEMSDAEYLYVFLNHKLL